MIDPKDFSELETAALARHSITREHAAALLNEEGFERIQDVRYQLEKNLALWVWVIDRLARLEATAIL